MSKKLPSEGIENNGNYAKSNDLIMAKYGANLAMNKIMSLAIRRAEKIIDPDTKQPRLVAKMKAGEFVDSNDGQQYVKIREAAKKLRQMEIFLEDREAKKFIMISIVSALEYEYGTGAITCYFEPKIEKYITNLKSQYTVFAWSVVKDFKSNTAFRLYEQLKRQCYTSKYARNKDAEYYMISYSIAALKFDLGLIDLSHKSIRKAFDDASRKNTKIDYEALVDELEKEDEENKEAQKTSKSSKKVKRNSKYPAFYDLKRRVLDPAIEEINEISDIQIDNMTTQTAGGAKKRKIDTVTFFVKLKDSSQQKSVGASPHVEYDEQKMIEMMNQMDDWLFQPITVNGKKAILEAAGYDINIVEAKIQLMNKQKGIENPTAWLIAAIKNDYQDNVYDLNDAEVIDIPSVETDENSEFLKLWNAYPNKTYRNLITKKVKKELAEVGWDKVKVAMDRYIQDVEKRREDGFVGLKYLNGGTFFRERYKEYLDETYDPYKKKKSSSNNQKMIDAMIQHEEDVDFDELAMKKARKMFGSME